MDRFMLALGVLLAVTTGEAVASARTTSSMEEHSSVIEYVPAILLDNYENVQPAAIHVEESSGIIRPLQVCESCKCCDPNDKTKCQVMSCCFGLVCDKPDKCTQRPVSCNCDNCN